MYHNQKLNTAIPALKTLKNPVINCDTYPDSDTGEMQYILEIGENTYFYPNPGQREEDKKTAAAELKVIPEEVINRAGNLIRIIADTRPAALTDEAIHEATKDTAAPLYCYNAAKLLRDAGIITMEKVNALIREDDRDRAMQILQDLHNEIDATLLFFCQTDLKIHGHITPGTAQAFNTQNRKFPELLKPFVKTQK